MKQRKASLSAENLTTGYLSRHDKEKVVTVDINASLYPGELTCLLGPNGAGKSTLLRTLSAFQPPLQGDVILESRPVGDYTPAELASIIGMVLTDRIDLPNMTVEELVAIGRSPFTGFWGRLSQKDVERVEYALRLIGVSDLASRRVATLSDGERQKVLIAKALAQETPVIFLDEPTAFLDYPSKVEVMRLLREIAWKENKTVFLSTHDLELALQIADRLWLIDKEHGVATGSPEDLALDGSLAAYFEREGVSLDTDTGLFRIDVDVKKSIVLRGEGRGKNLLKKALSRCEIGVADERDLGADTADSSHFSDALPVVTVIDTGFILGDKLFTSVEALLSEIN